MPSVSILYKNVKNMETEATKTTGKRTAKKTAKTLTLIDAIETVIENQRILNSRQQPSRVQSVR